MNTKTLNKHQRHLPSIDWIALGIGVVGLALSRLPIPGQIPWLGLLGFAVFGPPLLRELGLLTDADEYSRDIRWRAGFHAALAMALFVFLNRVLFPLIASDPEAVWLKTWFFPNGFLRQSLVMVFLLSYLIQYWGPRRGVFRILLGISGLTLIEGLMVGISWSHDSWMVFATTIVVAALMTGMAFLVRAKPRLGGRVLLVVGTLIISYTIIWIRLELDEVPSELRLNTLFGLVQVTVHMLLVFGATGVSLLKGNMGDEV